LKLFEFYQATPEGWQDVKDDHSQPKWGESRKTRLTLREINKMRRMNEVQSFERAKDLKKIRKQYAPPAQEGAGGLL
jgi:predicted dithiol-disulfide oxidoreductase (DUF899 family)